MRSMLLKPAASSGALLFGALLVLGLTLAGPSRAATVTVTPAPGTVRVTFDSLQALSGSSHREGNDFYVPILKFEVENASAGTLNGSAVTWTINGNPVTSTNRSNPSRSEILLSSSQGSALGAGPHLVRAVVPFSDTTVTAEWSVSFHPAFLSDARLRAQAVRVNKGPGTLPDTLGYRVAQADSVDGTLFLHWAVPPALDLSGDTLRAAQVIGGVKTAKGTTDDVFALRIRYAEDRSAFIVRARSAVVDSSYAPGFTMRQALEAIKLNFDASPRVGPVIPIPWSTSSASAKTENGWKIVSNYGYGDCPAGCIYNDENTYRVSMTAEGLKVCRTYYPPDHPSMGGTTCKVNGASAALSAAVGPRSEAVKGTAVRADGRALPGRESRAPQLRVRPAR